MRLARSTTEAINTQSKYVILIAFPRQQQLRERASLLRLRVQSLVFVIWPMNACTLLLLNPKHGKQNFSYDEHRIEHFEHADNSKF